MLLFPSTCADAAGVHSLFDDPLAAGSNQPGFARYAAQYGMTLAELKRHVTMGHIVLPVDAYADPGADAPVAVDADPCPTTPRLRDLPETMMMDLVASVAVVVDTDVIEARVSRAAHLWPGIQFPGDYLADPDNPPPRTVA
jgi:hypothetical protein